jgi:hypothetical protein
MWINNHLNKKTHFNINLINLGGSDKFTGSVFSRNKFIFLHAKPFSMKYIVTSDKINFIFKGLVTSNYFTNNAYDHWRGLVNYAFKFLIRLFHSNPLRLVLHQLFFFFVFLRNRCNTKYVISLLKWPIHWL